MQPSLIDNLCSINRYIVHWKASTSCSDHKRSFKVIGNSNDSRLSNVKKYEFSKFKMADGLFYTETLRTQYMYTMTHKKNKQLARHTRLRALTVALTKPKFPRWRPAAMLNLVQSILHPRKSYPRIKQEAKIQTSEKFKIKYTIIIYNYKYNKKYKEYHPV